MRLPCPICGERDRSEFYYRGAAVDRPEPQAGVEVWDDYLHLRDNPAGEVRELWFHESGCSAWIVVVRNTVSHAILGAVLAAEGRL